jgi:malate dehydrogenase (oxaloacetate-decarboxylating)
VTTDSVDAGPAPYEKAQAELTVTPDAPAPWLPRAEDPIFRLHEGGKVGVHSRVPLRDREDLAMAYTPGVAKVCTAIADNPELVHDYTWKSHTVAVVTDGTAVLGLGDIGPEASLPVMEGKALLFKEFGGIDAVPLALDCTGVDELVETVVRLAPSFGGINLEDISAPRCFEVEALLQERLDIPVFHDDQHGTAIVVLAGIVNACRLTGRSIGDLRAVVSGAGAAGVACTRILLDAGIGDIAVADSRGMLFVDRPGLTPVKESLARDTNRAGLNGTIEEALVGADVFLGLSAGHISDEAVATMADGAFVFAMANPDPEVDPEVLRDNISVIATGRSDYPNQINNVLAFPGVFKGALAVRASRVTPHMKRAAAGAIASLVADSELAADYVIPSVFDPRVASAVADAVATAAREDGVARL